MKKRDIGHEMLEGIRAIKKGERRKFKMKHDDLDNFSQEQMKRPAFK